MSETAPGGDSTGADNKTTIGTAASAATFVAGGIATIVGAIGSFGADDSALAAARRNHVSILIAASSAAALGLMLGGLYALLPHDTTTIPPASRKTWSRFLAWTRTNSARIVLGFAVAFVALGVGLGAYATANRQPGRP